MLSLSLTRSMVLLTAATLGFGAAPAGPETHQFDLTWDQHQNVTFAVDAPGPIGVNVTWNGAPLVVALTGPTGVVAQQTGTGRITLTHTATAAEVAKGSGWEVSLHSTSGSGSVAAIVARGTIVIDHPPGDIEKLRPRTAAAVKAQLALMRARAPQLAQQMMTAQRTELARYMQAEQQRRAQTVTHVASLRARAGAAPARRAVIPVAPGGGTHAAAPAITSLSDDTGQPGDALLISGSNFGQSASGTTVHILVAPGKDIVFGTPDYQSESQIQTSIPTSITGVPENAHAAIYVETAGGKSPIVPFHFKPTIVTAAIPLDSTAHPQVEGIGCDGWDGYDEFHFGGVQHAGGLFCGGSGDDHWNQGKRLANGWTVTQVTLTTQINPDANAGVSLSHAGTSDLSFTVHWWTTGAGLGQPGWVSYAPTIYVQGPAGLPYH